MADRKSPKPKKPKTARWQRIAMMDKEILDVEGAATLLGVSTTTIYNLGFQAFLAENLLCALQPLTLLSFLQWVIKKGVSNRPYFGL